MQQWSVPAWLVIAALVLGLVVLVVLGTLVFALARTRARLAETTELAQRLEDVERRLATRDSKVHDPAIEGPQPGTQREPAEEYVITNVGAPEPAPTVPAPLFADLVLRESLVQVVSYAAGVRRAFSAENRNRIRFEMKREVRRARKQRKADIKQARREWEAHQRAALDEDDAA